MTPGTNGAYWIRLHLAEFDDPSWLIIESFPEVADTVQIIYVKLLCLAGKCNSEGLLLLPGGKPYGEAELAAVLRRQPTTISAALQMLEGYGFVERVGDPPALALPAWLHQDVDALALLADKRQRDAERKRIKRSEIKQLQASADTSADVPRNVRTQRQRQRQRQKTTADAAVPPAAPLPSNTLPPELQSAVGSLPQAIQSNVQDVLRDEPGSIETKLAALQLLQARLAAGKVANAGAYLRTAIQGRYSLPATASPAPQPEALAAQEAEAWAWWQGLGEAQQERLGLEYQSHLLGIPRLTDRRKALILFRLRDELQEAA